MTKTKEQLEIDLAREIKYSAALNKKIDALNDRLKNFISKEEHEKEMRVLKGQCENKLAEINNQQIRQHNERGAGRKKKATKQVIQRVLELRTEGLSQANISKAVEAELGVTISRTTVGEIVRGEHGDGTA